jgi:hypothetical protein
MRWTAVRFAGSPLRRFAGSPVRRLAASPLRRLLPRRTRPGAPAVPMSLLARCSIAWCAPERYR